jgi:hypothetical protein
MPNQIDRTRGPDQESRIGGSVNACRCGGVNQFRVETAYLRENIKLQVIKFNDNNSTSGMRVSDYMATKAPPLARAASNREQNKRPASVAALLRAKVGR